MKKKIWLAATALFLSAAGSVEARDLVTAEVQPPDHAIVKAEEFLGTRLGELSRGSLAIQLHHSGQLGNESQAWEKVRTGKLDIARVNAAVLGSEVPAARVLSLPYLFRSRDHLWHTLSGDFGTRLANEIDRAGAIVLTYYDSGTRSFYTTRKPIRTHSDFAGLRIRVQDSPVYRDLITMLGGKPVSVPFDKVDEALKNGTIDGAENNLPSYVSSEHYKYARYYTVDEHSTVPEVLLISKKTWNTLSADQKKQLQAAAKDSSVLMKKLWAESEARSREKARKEGVTIIEKGQISLAGIESFAVKIYNKYATDQQDFAAVMNIVNSR